MSAAAEIPDHVEDDVEQITLLDNEYQYDVPKGLLQRLQLTERTQEALIEVIQAHDELYFLLIEYRASRNDELESLPESFKDSAIQNRREELIREMASLDDLCIKIRSHRAIFADYENYMRLTSVPATFYIPNSFG